MKPNLKYDLGIPVLIPTWKKLFTTQYLREDLIAGITVACIAAPLSLAIALACGVPPANGLSTAIIAGIICALFGGTPLAVSGPANAIPVLVASVMHEKGAEALLIIGLICGALQLLSGVLRLGSFIRFVPFPVISAFTAGIGAIIVLGQIPKGLGISSPPHSRLFEVVSHLLGSLSEIQPTSVLLCASAIGICLGLPYLSKRRLPAPLIAVITLTGLSVIFGLAADPVGHIPRQLPPLNFPHWPDSNWGYLIQTGFIFYLLVSLETLLSCAALDKLAGSERHDSDQELVGQGLGNLISSLFGGVPVTGVVARSALNIQAGARTRRAAIFHSLVLIGIILFLAPWIEQIPVAVLAGVLMSVGLRMLHPKELLFIWKISSLEGVVYLLTFFVMINTDLLTGIETGIISSLIILAVRLSQTRSQFHESRHETGPYRCVLDGAITFMSAGKLEALRTEINTLDNGQGVIFDMSRLGLMDSSGAGQILDIVSALLQKSAKVALLVPSPSHQTLLQAADPTHTVGALFAEHESELETVLGKGTDSIAVDRLISGVQQFQENSKRRYYDLFEKLAHSQDPHTLFMTCSDSRISPDLITSAHPGELFVVRNVGNMFPIYSFDNTPAEAAALEFAVGILGVSEIVVCGHSGCGAMKAIVSQQKLSEFPNLERWLESASHIREKLPTDATPEDAARLNVVTQITHLYEYPIIQTRIKTGDLRIHGWFYDIGTGTIEEWSVSENRFLPIGQTTNS